MSTMDVEYLRTWIGRSRIDEDLISVRQARLMAATIDYRGAAEIREGAILPPLWYWTSFLEGVPARELGEDGHPARGGFMPPVPLPNRMWAGGRVSFRAPVIIGTVVRKESCILKVDHKVGSSGELVFVTVLHELKTLEGALLVREEQDIVYKGTVAPGRTAVPPPPAPSQTVARSYTPTPVMLFRYSALTFNGHRIHYDADYCREQEGYPNVVVHGPLNATMLAGHAEEVAGKRLVEFSYRGLAPAFLGDTITLHATVEGDRIALLATLGNGSRCMEAEAQV